ncbi:MAG: cytochrome c3 family protein [Dissulfurispiraceae bacterium]|jgi:hypothetical protein
MKNTSVVIFAMLSCLLVASLLYAASPTSPGVIMLDSVKDKYDAVRFDHGKHTSLAGNCGTCHHEHGDNSSLPCKECHALTPDQFKQSVTRSFTACKGCHISFDRSNPKMPGLKVAYHKKCFQCHRGMGDVGIDPKGCTVMCHAKREQKISKRIGN